MFLDRLLKKQPAWPADLPRLYPALDERELCSFLSREEHARIAKLPMVGVLPFISRDGQPAEIKQRLLSGKFDPAESLHGEIRRLQEKL